MRVTTLITDENFFTIKQNQSIVDGVNFETASILPDYTYKNFIKALAQNFNLIFDTNVLTKTVTIETENTYYKDINDSEDWEDKVDFSENIEITRLSEFRKFLNWKYREDGKDDLLESFEANYFQFLGDSERELLNENLTDSQDVASLPYSPSVMGYTFLGSNVMPLYMPRLINQDAINKDIETDGVGESFDFNSRLYIYGGYRELDASFSLFKLTGASLTQTGYPFAYFMKEVSGQADVSLAFENLKDVNNSLQANDKGLVDRLYNKLLDRLNYGRVIECYLRLSEVDILNLDFTKPKLLKIGGNSFYCILDNVEDFIVGSDDPVKCTFVTVATYNTF